MLYIFNSKAGGFVYLKPGDVMKKMYQSFVILNKYLVFLICSTLTTSCGINCFKTEANRIQVDSSGYWKYNGQRTLLLGGFNHGHNPFIDGSTLDDVKVNSMEDIVAQIQEMVDTGGNTLRCVLDPGYATAAGIDVYQKNADGLYDLNKPTGPFWDRLSTFIAEAEKRNVIVELEIWDRFDWHNDVGGIWDKSPFHPDNNCNYTIKSSGLAADYARKTIYKKHPFSKGVPGHPVYESAPPERKAQYDEVRKYQEIFFCKVLSCAFPYKNVLYNMNNETSEHIAWGEYWIALIKTKAEKQKVSIVCTNMQDGTFNGPDSDGLNHQLMHPKIYDYLDVSQGNSRLRDETHWEVIKWIANQATDKGFLLHMTKLYGSDDREPDPWASFKPGVSDNAVEEWWRNLIAGVAGVRFHRPKTGIGLSEKAKACIRATRKIESKVKFWDVIPRLNLLTDREIDEAYLAVDPGAQYILYFTHNGGGSVGLNLENFKDKQFDIHWVNIDTGNWGSTSTITGGQIATISRPDNTAHWVAAILAED